MLTARARITYQSLLLVLAVAFALSAQESDRPALPENADEIMATGDQLYHEGRFLEAALAWGQVADIDSSHLGSGAKQILALVQDSVQHGFTLSAVQDGLASLRLLDDAGLSREWQREVARVRSGLQAVMDQGRLQNAAAVLPTATPPPPTPTPVVPTPTPVPVLRTATPIPATATPVLPTRAPVVPTAVAPTATPVVPTPTSIPSTPTAAPVIPTPTRAPVIPTPTEAPPASAAAASPSPSETTAEEEAAPARGVEEGEIVPLTADVVPPRLIERIPPRYPRSAERMRVSGNVRLRILVGVNGEVEEFQITSVPQGGLGFEREIEAVVPSWKFSPATLNGVAVRVWIPVAVPFRLVD